MNRKLISGLFAGLGISIGIATYAQPVAIAASDFSAGFEPITTSAVSELNGNRWRAPPCGCTTRVFKKICPEMPCPAL